MRGHIPTVYTLLYCTWYCSLYLQVYLQVYSHIGYLCSMYVRVVYFTVQYSTPAPSSDRRAPSGTVIVYSYRGR